jgi:hypothetical protein
MSVKGWRLKHEEREGYLAGRKEGVFVSKKLSVNTYCSSSWIHGDIGECDM